MDKVLETKTTEDGNSVLVRELTVGDVRALTSIAKESDLSAAYVLRILLSDPDDIKLCLKDEDLVAALFTASSTLNPDVFKKSKQVGNVKPELQAIIEQANELQFTESLASMLINGHPNVLSYPFSIFATIVRLLNKSK